MQPKTSGQEARRPSCIQPSEARSSSIQSMKARIRASRIRPTEARRASSIQPRVARRALPWVSDPPRFISSERAESSAAKPQATERVDAMGPPGCRDWYLARHREEDSALSELNWLRVQATQGNSQRITLG